MSHSTCQNSYLLMYFLFFNMLNVHSMWNYIKYRQWNREIKLGGYCDCTLTLFWVICDTWVSKVPVLFSGFTGKISVWFGKVAKLLGSVSAFDAYLIKVFCFVRIIPSLPPPPPSSTYLYGLIHLHLVKLSGHLSLRFVTEVWYCYGRVSFGYCPCPSGACSGVVVKALHYKQAGRGFDSRWCNEIFQWHNPSGHTMALGSTQPLTEMSTRCVSWW